MARALECAARAGPASCAWVLMYVFLHAGRLAEPVREELTEYPWAATTRSDLVLAGSVRGSAPGQVFPHLAGGRLAFWVRSAAPFSCGRFLRGRFPWRSPPARLVELGRQARGKFPGPGPVVPLLHQGEGAVPELLRQAAHPG